MLCDCESNCIIYTAMDSDKQEKSADGVDEETTVYESREEYLKKLQNWLNDARLWHGYCAGFPYYMNVQNQNSLLHQLNYSPGQSILFQRRTEDSNAVPLAQTVLQPGTYEYVIPSVWKRLMAELVDFLILLIIKMALTFLLLEGFNLISLEYYGFESFQKNFQNPKIAMQISIELLTLEIIHRAVACAYEAYFLKGGTCATPGKRYMGLMVVRVGNIQPVFGRPNETILVSNCSALGLKRSIIRTVLKNLFIGLMLPVCFALYFFRFNRTAYDVMADSIVVETNPNFINYQHGL